MFKKFITYLKEIKSEAKKISWLSRKEAISISAMVIFWVFISSIFFFIVDILVSNIIALLIGI